MTPNTFYLDFSVTKFCYGKEVDYVFKNLPQYSHSFHIEMQEYKESKLKMLCKMKYSTNEQNFLATRRPWTRTDT